MLEMLLGALQYENMLIYTCVCVCVCDSVQAQPGLVGQTRSWFE